jgi:arylsulfatase A
MLPDYTIADRQDPELDGTNVAALLEGYGHSPGREFLYCSKWLRLRGLRCGEWKYLRHGRSMHQTAKDAPELYNLREDIGEHTNLAKARPELAASFEEELQRFKKGRNRTPDKADLPISGSLP